MKTKYINTVSMWMLMSKNMFLPLPSNISYWWNFGSLLGMCLVIQIITGLFISMFYKNDMTQSFESVVNMTRNVNMGWMMRSVHANGASMFFIFIYLHIGRGLFFKSFLSTWVWLTGVMMLLLLMMTAFIGYVLPWGQMSFWGATVITNLLSSFPYIGSTMTIWIWGDFSVNSSTLMRFFTFHFILPFIIIFMSIIHIMFLHNQKSSNPLGMKKDLDKIPFVPYFSVKDLISMLLFMMMFTFICLSNPMIMMDPDNFILANPMITPPHIQPEWYFLFAYAILRTIPSKLGGVLSLLMSIMVLMILPLLTSNSLNNNMLFKVYYKMMFFFWMINLMYLTVMGGMPIEQPYIMISKMLSLNYFVFYMLYI